MSELFVRNIPSIKEREFKYRGRMNSHELNEVQQEAFNDILDLFNKANQLQKTIYEMNMASAVECACYAQRLEESRKQMAELQEKYNNLTSTEEDFRYLTQYGFEAKNPINGFEAVIDKNTNDVVAHIVSSHSKTRLYDATYNEALVPDSLQVFIGPDTFRTGEKIFSIEDSNIKNAFDGNDSTIWVRKVVTTAEVESIENEIVIGLPEDIVTTRLMNQILLKVFPVGYLDIMDIKYKSNGAWTTIPGFSCHDGYAEETETDIFGNSYTIGCIRNASNMKFNFPALQTNQLKIKLRQRNYTYDAENNRRIWYLGLRDCDANFNVYTRDHSEFEMVYDFQEKDRTIKVYDTEIFFNNSDKMDDDQFGIFREYFYFDADGNTHKIPSTCPFVLTGHKMMVRYTIEGRQETPNVHMCRVKYKLA